MALKSTTTLRFFYFNFAPIVIHKKTFQFQMNLSNRGSYTGDFEIIEKVAVRQVKRFLTF